MNVLFIHQAFPAQFGRLALELTKRYGWRCDFLVENLSSCPTPSAEMLEQLKLYRIQTPAESRDQSPTPWPQIHAKYLGLCGAVFNSAKGIPDLKPDLIVGHGGRGSPTVFLPDLFDCPLLNYCEYYFSTDPRSDISYRVDLPPATDVAPFFPRCINAPVLVALTNADGGYSATHWQKQSFPKRFHHKIEVQFDGIDTEVYCPKEGVPRVIAGRTIPKETKIVTFVARGLESMRGFDVFMKVAARVARQRSDVLFVIAGNDHAYYGWDPLHTGQKSFKSWVLDRVKHDPDRFLFTGHVLPEELADILRLSDLHLYLTVPFVLSWSLLNAMACGCVVLGSDVPPVREVIDDGVHGLIEPLFDLDRLTEAALRVLDDPAAHKPLADAARVRMETDYSLDACVPRLKDYFERMASRRFQTQPTENSESPKPRARRKTRKKTDSAED